MDIAKKLRLLERNHRILQFSLIGLVVLWVGMASSPPTQSTLLLESPNGQYKILLKATDTCAGIWISGDSSGSMSVMVNQEKTGSVIGIYGPKLDGKSWKSMDVAVTANKDGGYIMISNSDQTNPKFITNK